MGGMGGKVDRFDDHSAPTRERQRRGDQKNQQRALESSEDRVCVWCILEYSYLLSMLLCVGVRGAASVLQLLCDEGGYDAADLLR